MRGIDAGEKGGCVVRHMLLGSVVIAVMAGIARGTSPSATWEIRAYESWQGVSADEQ